MKTQEEITAHMAKLRNAFDAVELDEERFGAPAERLKVELEIAEHSLAWVCGKTEKTPHTYCCWGYSDELQDAARATE